MRRCSVRMTRLTQGGLGCILREELEESTRCGVLHMQVLRFGLWSCRSSRRNEGPAQRSPATERRTPPHPISSWVSRSVGAPPSMNLFFANRRRGMEDTIRLYTLFSNRAYVRSVCRAPFSTSSTIAITSPQSLCDGPLSNYVTDFVLSRVGPYNVRFLFIYRTFTAFAITATCWPGGQTGVPFTLRRWRVSALVRACSWRSPMAPSPIVRSSPHRSPTRFLAATCSFPATGLPLLAALAFWHIPNGGCSISR